MWASACLALIMFGDWAAQEWFQVPSTNRRRLATGLSGGIGVGVVFWSVWRLVLFG